VITKVVGFLFVYRKLFQKVYLENIALRYNACGQKRESNMRTHSVFGLTFITMMVFIVMSIVITSSLPNTRIRLDPSDYMFDSGAVSIGTKFNVTLTVDEVEGLVAWQVKMFYNDSIINITRWFEPTWDHGYVFYGKTTFAAPIPPENCAYDHLGPGNGSIQVGAILLPLPPSQTSFSGSGKLCICEFTITAIPFGDETLSCLLSINNSLTYLLDRDGGILPNVTKEDGYYELYTRMFTLTITTTLGGTTAPSPAEYRYSAGTRVQVLAIPEINNLFDHWELDGENAGVVNPIEVSMDSNHTLHATFRLLTYNLVLSTTAGGTTNPTPGTYTYVNGTLVSITAIPSINNKFGYWLLGGVNAGSDNPIHITMISNHSLQAVFTQVTYWLTIATTAGGTTNPEPGNYTYVNGTVVSVKAIPEATYVFDHWKLDGINIGSNNPVNILMDTNHTILAVFALPRCTLTITSSPGGTTNPTPGIHNYTMGSLANVAAIPNPNYLFDHWLLDGKERTENPITVQMDANYTLHAVFTLLTYELTITVTQGGTTAPSPGNYIYTNGTIASVASIPSTGYEFAYWELDGINIGSDSPIEILMHSNLTLRAVFNPIVYHLSIYAVERPSGTTDPPAGTHIYIIGTILNVTALHDPGFSFDYWSLDSEKIIENPITIVMNTDHMLIPYFVDNIPPEIGAVTQDPSENVMVCQNVTVTVSVIDLGTGVHNVTLWYSINKGATWKPLSMTEITPNTYQATIPRYKKSTWVRYRIIAYDNNGNRAISDYHGYYIQAYTYGNKINRSIVFVLGALIAIISGVFLLMVKARMGKQPNITS